MFRMQRQNPENHPLNEIVTFVYTDYNAVGYA